MAGLIELAEKVTNSPYPTRSTDAEVVAGWWRHVPKDIAFYAAGVALMHMSDAAADLIVASANVVIEDIAPAVAEVVALRRGEG